MLTDNLMIGQNRITKVSLKVLLVEASNTNRQLLSKLLESSGFTIMGEASDGKEALNIFNNCKQKPDILITNIELEGVNGIELINAVVSKHPGIRVMVLTQNKDILEKFLMVDFYIDVVLQKPISPALFINELRKLSNDLENVLGYCHDTKRFLNAVVVDDSAVSRIYISKVLFREKFNVPFFAENGLIAIDKLQRFEHIDYLITDIDMPGMNGTDLILSLRNTYPSLNIIVSTAIKNPILIEKLFQLDIEFILYKPYTLKSLREILFNKKMKSTQNQFI
jgi:CheY-like chemotaxis protein